MTTQIKLNRTDLRSLAKVYKTGLSLCEVADKFGFSVPTVRRLLLEAKVTIRPRGRQKNS